jgi:hypothetical protein
MAWRTRDGRMSQSAQRLEADKAERKAELDARAAEIKRTADQIRAGDYSWLWDDDTN